MLACGARGLGAGGPTRALPGGLYDVIWEGLGAGPWVLAAGNPDGEQRARLEAAAQSLP